MFLKRHSILKPIPIENDFGNKSTFVKLKNLDKNIRFIIDGYYDFEKKIWMDNKRSIREGDWFQSKKYYLNYPVMNDRIAFTKGKIGIDIPSKWPTWDAHSRIPMAISSDFLNKFNLSNGKVVLAPSLCGENCFRVIRDIDHRVEIKTVIENMVSKICRTRRLVLPKSSDLKG